MIHRNISVEEDKDLKANINQRQNQGQKYRYFINIPDYSAVIENPQSMKNLGTSQASLLEKIAFENDKIYDSSIFQQNKERIFDTRVVDQMKFSFNNNQSKEKLLKQSNLNEQVTKYHHGYSKLTSNITNKNEIFQKKPSKQILKEESAHINMESIKNKYITNKQNDKKIAQRIKIIDEQKQFNDLDSFSKENYVIKLDGKQSERHLDKTFQKVVIKDKSSRDQILPLSKQLSSRHNSLRETIDRQVKANSTVQKQNLKFQIQSSQTRHLQKIFQNLDSSKTGKIDKYNLNIKNIKQQFQLIFGLIFYRIKFCNDSFNKKDFINFYLECLKLLKRQNVLILFKEQEDGAQRQKNIKKERQQRQRILRQKEKYRMQQLIKEKEEKYKLLIQKEQKQIILKQKEQRQKMLRQRDQRQRKIKEIEQKEKYDIEQRLMIMKQLQQKQKILRQREQEQRQKLLKKNEQIKQRSCQNCKSLSKFERKEISHSILQDSPPKQTNSNIQQGLSLNKRVYVELKEVREEKQLHKKMSPQKNHHTYKYQTNPISSRASDYLGESKNVSQYKQKKIAQAKIQHIDYEEAKVKISSTKKKRNISQQIIREHKRSLEEIHKLNDKVEKCIYNKPVAQITKQLQKQSRLNKYYQSYGVNNKI